MKHVFLFILKNFFINSTKHIFFVFENKLKLFSGTQFSNTIFFFFENTNCSQKLISIIVFKNNNQTSPYILPHVLFFPKRKTVFQKQFLKNALDHIITPCKVSTSVQCRGFHLSHAGPKPKSQHKPFVTSRWRPSLLPYENGTHSLYFLLMLCISLIWSMCR